MQSLVSLIVPCYNASVYLDNTLSSIERQTYSEIEVILINDGSTDHTLEICKIYKSKSRYPVKIIDGPNSGVSIARNKGIAASEGEYISFLDADDSLDKNAIKVLVEMIETENADIAYAVWSRILKEIGKKIDKTYNVQDTHKAMNIFMKKKYRVAFFNYLYKRKIIMDRNIDFYPGLKYGEDNLFFWKYLCYVNKAVFTNIPLYWYNNNEQSAMYKSSKDNLHAVDAMYIAKEYMKNANFKYLSEFSAFVPPRTMLSVAKEYSKHNDIENYKYLLQKYPVRKLVKTLIFKDNFVITIAAIIMLLSPKLFYIFFNKVSNF